MVDLHAQTTFINLILFCRVFLHGLSVLKVTCNVPKIHSLKIIQIHFENEKKKHQI